MVREQNLLHMYSLILDIRETANFDFPFPHASSYQAKSNLVLGDSQNAVVNDGIIRGVSVTRSTWRVGERKFSEQ